ncbi:MAG: YfhO family protein, partial [Calditrichia bacterium]
MAKKKKTTPKETKIEAKSTTKFSLDTFEKPAFILGFFIFLFIVLVVLYKPLVFEGMEPNGSDIVSGVGKTHQLKMWEEKTGHYPLWNPYMFGGMPTYQRFGPRVWSFDTLLSDLGFLTDWRIWYYLAGALGLFLLVKYLGLSAAAGMLAALGFVLMPHFQALIIVGHFAKFRAIMWMPWVLLTLLYFLNKRNLLSALLFSLALAMQFRTQHYQIIFYTLMLVAFFAIPVLYKLIFGKKWPEIGKIFGFSAFALVLMVLISAQNLLSIKEYTPYSTRGGNAISINNTQTSEQEKKGVGFDYATAWSYSVSEWWNLIVPKFHGGISNELYTGSAVLGFVFEWHRWEVKSLTFLTVLALLMSLGKNFSILYKTFFVYVPYFDKFRAPVMILTMVMFNIAVLAAFGLSFILRSDLQLKEIKQRFYVVSGIFIVILMIPVLFGSSLSLMQAQEAQRYNPEILNMLKKVRLEMLRNSSMVSLLFLLLGVGTIWGVQKKWFRVDFLPVIIILAVLVDFWVLDTHYVKGKFINPRLVEQKQYAKTPIDQTLLQNDQLFRVFPTGRLFSDTRWVYYYQSIGGYSPAKLQGIQEIVDNCLYAGLGDGVPINWNVLDMLNVQYLISNQSLSSSHLKTVASDEKMNLFAQENSGKLPRAYFVNNYVLIPDGVERLKYLNRPDFDPARTAILEEKPSETIEVPDSAYAKVVSYAPEQIEYSVYTDKPALLMLSEIYYPKGWRAFLDGEQDIKIYKTNHLLRSVVVPAGEHSIVFNFHPESYYLGLWISLVSLVGTYLL